MTEAETPTERNQRLARERQARRYVRQRDGLIVLPVEVSEVDLVETLAARGLVPSNCEDRGRLVAGLADLIRNLLLSDAGKSQPRDC